VFVYIKRNIDKDKTNFRFKAINRKKRTGEMDTISIADGIPQNPKYVFDVNLGIGDSVFV
jgi:hypothetical protein